MYANFRPANLTRIIAITVSSGISKGVELKDYIVLTERINAYTMVMNHSRLNCTVCRE